MRSTGPGDEPERAELAGGALGLDPVLLGDLRVVALERLHERVVVEELDRHRVLEPQLAVLLHEPHVLRDVWVPRSGDSVVAIAGTADRPQRHDHERDDADADALHDTPHRRVVPFGRVSTTAPASIGPMLSTCSASGSSVATTSSPRTRPSGPGDAHQQRPVAADADRDAAIGEELHARAGAALEVDAVGAPVDRRGPRAVEVTDLHRRRVRCEVGERIRRDDQPGAGEHGVAVGGAQPRQRRQRTVTVEGDDLLDRHLWFVDVHGVIGEELVSFAASTAVLSSAPFSTSFTGSMAAT